MFYVIDQNLLKSISSSEIMNYLNALVFIFIIVILSLFELNHYVLFEPY